MRAKSGPAGYGAGGAAGGEGGETEHARGKMSSSDPDLQRREIGAANFVSAAETQKFLLVGIGTFIDVRGGSPHWTGKNEEPERGGEGRAGDRGGGIDKEPDGNCE